MLANILPPPARFNFAQHLITLNATRAGKTALIDDLGTLSYGELADRCSASPAASSHWACAAKTGSSC